MDSEPATGSTAAATEHCEIKRCLKRAIARRLYRRIQAAAAPQTDRTQAAA